jgi:hypothetical protein
MGWFSKRPFVLGVSATLLAGSLLTAGTALPATKSTDFDLIVSKGAATCLPQANGKVHVSSVGPVEIMTVDVNGLLPKSDFDLFVLQLPTRRSACPGIRPTFPPIKTATATCASSASSETRLSPLHRVQGPRQSPSPLTRSATREIRSLLRASIPKAARSRCITSACGSIHRLTRRTLAAPVQ